MLFKEIIVVFSKTIQSLQIQNTPLQIFKISGPEVPKLWGATPEWALLVLGGGAS
jgi:hypothetical protein